MKPTITIMGLESMIKAKSWSNVKQGDHPYWHLKLKDTREKGALPPGHPYKPGGDQSINLSRLAIDRDHPHPLVGYQPEERNYLHQGNDQGNSQDIIPKAQPGDTVL